MPGDAADRSTRDKILIAAATMLEEDPTGRFSVRGVAARAGVSTGSLRHFFPTQQVLIDTVVAGLVEVELPDDPIHDDERTAEDRLEACLQLMLRQLGTGERARASWRQIHEAYIASDPHHPDATSYSALEQLGLARIARWLRVLADEGAITTDGIEVRARFLTTVLNGIYIERALPADHDTQQRFEATTIRLAIRTVLE